MPDPATIVIVPGAFCGRWSLWKLLPALAARGITSVGVDLPSRNANDNSIDVHDDIAHVHKVIDAIDGPVLLAGKSYGGAVITGVDHPQVAHLLYIAAVMPRPGEPFLATLASATLPNFAAGLHNLNDGPTRCDADVGARNAFAQANADDKDVWRRNGTPISFGPDASVSLSAALWQRVPSTYVVCGQDLVLDPQRQRQGAVERATEVVELPFDHTPGASHPDDIAEMLKRVAYSAGPTSPRCRRSAGAVASSLCRLVGAQRQRGAWSLMTNLMTSKGAWRVWASERASAAA